MKIRTFIIILLLSIFQFSCSNVLCGNLSGDWLVIKSSAEEKFSKQFFIEAIPCDFYYINIKVKDNIVDSASLKALHFELYDSIKKVGWPTFVLFDKEGNYLYHDVNNGVRYRK